MNLEARTYSYLDSSNKIMYAYDIVDLDDMINDLPELVAEAPKSWATESAAEKNATLHIKELING